MNRTRALGTVGILAAGAVLLAAAASPPGDKVASATATAHPAGFDKQGVWQTFKVYCDSCHTGPKAKAKLDLESLNVGNFGDHGETW